jgi:hypothetical protein
MRGGLIPAQNVITAEYKSHRQSIQRTISESVDVEEKRDASIAFSFIAR